MLMRNRDKMMTNVQYISKLLFFCKITKHLILLVKNNHHLIAGLVHSALKHNSKKTILFRMAF